MAGKIIQSSTRWFSTVLAERSCCGVGCTRRRLSLCCGHSGSVRVVGVWWGQVLGWVGEVYRGVDMILSVGRWCPAWCSGIPQYTLLGAEVAYSGALLGAAVPYSGTLQ